MCKKLICLVSLVFVLTLVLTNGASAADPSLAGWWPFDGHAIDASGNGRHGTLVGGAHLISTGVFGGALELDGVDDYVSVDGYKGILQSPWTLACWVKTTTAGDLDILSWGTEGGGLKVEFRLHDGRLRI